MTAALTAPPAAPQAERVTAQANTLPIPYPMQPNTIYAWDALTTARTMKACGMRVNAVVTSPPYFGLRNYGVDGQIGLEQTPAAYVAALVEVFRAVRDVLTDDGVCWINIGDSYNGSGKGWTGHNGIGNQERRQGFRAKKTDIDGLKSKDLIGIPWRVAFALQADSWYLRSDVIWHKPNPMPESVTDRPTKAHEYVFLLTKQPNYWYEAAAIAEPIVDGDTRAVAGSQGVLGGPNARRRMTGGGFSKAYAGAQLKHGGESQRKPYETRNKRSVWAIPTEPSSIPHFAMMPRELARTCILAGCPVGGLVFDPFMGVGTTAIVARSLGRNYIGSEINQESVAWANERLRLPFEQHYVTPKADDYAGTLFASADVAAGGAP